MFFDVHIGGNDRLRVYTIRERNAATDANPSTYARSCANRSAIHEYFTVYINDTTNQW
ncbi:MAG: hypothetical protein FWB94_12505 [Chitinispirillia bacterium]|nr:hypothetical protein [Chitinispirillia bacterium]